MTGPDAATAVTWPCGNCGETVTAEGSSPPGYPQHVATGYEPCEDSRGQATPDPRQCAHVPEPDTAYSVTGLPVTLHHPSDYPADAKCRTCGQWLRLDAIGAPAALKYPERM